MRKRFLSLFSAVLMAASLLVVLPAMSAGASGGVAAKVSSLISEYEGKTGQFEHGDASGCLGFAKIATEYVFGLTFYRNNKNNAFEKKTTLSGSKLNSNNGVNVGDILNRTDNGHTSMVVAVDGSSCTVIEWASSKGNKIVVRKTSDAGYNSKSWGVWHANNYDEIDGGSTTTFSWNNLGYTDNTVGENATTMCAQVVTNGTVSSYGFEYKESDVSSYRKSSNSVGYEENGNNKKWWQWFNDLIPGTTYNVRAYATVNGSKYTSSVYSFTTPGTKPSVTINSLEVIPVTDYDVKIHVKAKLSNVTFSASNNWNVDIFKTYDNGRKGGWYFNSSNDGGVVQYDESTGELEITTKTKTLEKSTVYDDINVWIRGTYTGAYSYKSSIYGKKTISYTTSDELATHSYGSWTTTKAATCTTAGTQTRTCTVCGQTETQEIEALGHNYQTKVVKPTMSSDGYTLHKCSRCGTSYKDSIVSKPVLKSDGYYYCDTLPSDVTSSDYTIEYKNYQTKVATTSPGSDWTNSGVAKTEWVNSGGQYENYHYALSTSDSRVLVGTKYYHYCGPNAGTKVNYELTGNYVHWDSVDGSKVSVSSQGTDSTGGMPYYILTWNDGSGKVYCNSSTTCDGSYGSHGNRAYAWYKIYIYQDRTKVTYYNYVKDVWSTTKDSASTSTAVRFKTETKEIPKLDYLPGDVNLDDSVDIKDMSMVYKHINGTKTLTAAQVEIADVNSDDSVDIKDYSKIYKHINGTVLLW